MNDKSKMPFGKHKGKPMEKVPASYLLWLADQSGFSTKNSEMTDYIEDNRTLLEKEAAE